MSENNTNNTDTEAVATADEVTTQTEVTAETTTNTEPQNVPIKEEAKVEVASEDKTAAKPSFQRADRRGPARKRITRKPGDKRGGRPARPERAKPEFDQKILDIRRVTRVVSGGRRFSFSVAIVIGDGKGRVGLGSGKSTDTSLAIEKAVKDARKKMITLKLTKSGSISHDLNAKFASSQIFMMPNRERGLIAGSSARVILSLAGVKDVTAKFFSGSKNKLNNGKVAMKALEQIAYKRGEEPIVKKVEMVESESTDKKV